jgi:hypothetical protein
MVSEIKKESRGRENRAGAGDMREKGSIKTPVKMDAPPEVAPIKLPLRKDRNNSRYKDDNSLRCCSMERHVKAATCTAKFGD